MLLEDMIERDLVDVKTSSPKDWKEALKQASDKLIEHGYIKPGYTDEIINNVVTNGPYIVIVPGVAMPHAMAESDNVLGTAIGFTKFPQPVVFDENNPDSHAQLFFTLAARDPKIHLKNISDLSEVLMADGFIEKLLNIQNVEDFKKIVKEYQE
ncbi:MAG: PTS sugar transporter subunit IIA [Lactobacillus sp.]|jgi:ascorbate PTS system EIIA or EIIAB component|uniref:PTS sugar transporter subunit IIA n=1 Tax=Bombilactobacillus bombi TaxID=1303590 RepID=UPI0035EEDA07|nr:PTS sugar transporter subunit IIA [Lactobacillus sp.]